jgi:hypothetical protein
LDESDSEKWISKKRSRKAGNEKKKKKGFKETVNEKLNGNASGSDSQAAKAQVNVVKDSKPSNENVNSPEWRKKRSKKMVGCRFCWDHFDESEAMRIWPRLYPSKVNSKLYLLHLCMQIFFTILFVRRCS